MKLTYRGVSYESNNNTAPVAGVDLRYRGANYRLHQAAQADNLNAILKYRGATDATQPSETAPVTAIEQTTNETATVLPLEEQARLLNVNHYRGVKNRQQSLLKRHAFAVGLMADTAKYWNHIKGEIHPTFWINYDRSHVAMS